MTRLIPLSIHSAIEIALASALMAAPFVFGFGPAGLVTAFVIGSLMMGLAISASGEGRGGLPVMAHAAYDRGIAFGLVLAAGLLGLAGDASALLVLTAASLALVALSVNTRYSAVRA
ncbi:MAG TPA: hypothetical protein VNT32_04260 [Thermoleophilaceae bacterium]|nr:hypothetical protein [Thermoleophilaceae bacterium]